MPPRIPIFRSPTFSYSFSPSFRRLTTTATTTTTTPTHPPSPPPAGIAPLPSRAVIHLSGPDAAKYLQGAITAPVVAVSSSPSSSSSSSPQEGDDQRGFYAAFLTAQGRVRHDVFVHPDPHAQAFYIDVDASAAPGLVALIRRYRLRAKFDVRLCDDARVWHAWDDSSSGGTQQQLQQLLRDDGTKVVEDTRSPGLGLRILRLSKDSPPPMRTREIGQVDETAFRIRRMLAGVPEGQAEIVADSALPLECNMDLMGGIDFHKGCYVGQELTIRTKHRGVVRKRVLPCVVYRDGDDPSSMPTKLEYDPSVVADAAAVPAGTSIGRVGKRGRSAGRWLGGVGNVGLALCRLEIMTDVTLPGEVAASPYDPADEFVVEWPAEEAGGKEGKVAREAGRVKIKAFVPPWIRKSIPRGERWWDEGVRRDEGDEES